MATLQELTEKDEPQCPMNLTRRYLVQLSMHGGQEAAIPAFVELNGTPMKVRGPYPDELRGDGRDHELRQCFRNATMLASAHENSWYCEGYAISPWTGFPVAHAWVLHARHGVLDPTWPDQEGAFYYGIAYDRLYKMTVTVETSWPHILWNPILHRDKTLDFPDGLKKHTVNVSHEHIWTPEVLAERAKKQG